MHTVKINGIEITGFAYDDWFTIERHHKLKLRGGRQELFVKESTEGRKIFRDLSTIMEKHIDVVPAKDGWLRVRPAFSEKEMKIINNYFRMVEEV